MANREGREERSIRSIVKQKRLTIYDIKRRVEGKTYYFSKSTLRFFNQKMSDFHVRTSRKGNIYIYAPGYWLVDGKRTLMGYSFMRFDPDRDNLADVDYVMTSVEDIEKYMKEW